MKVLWKKYGEKLAIIMRFLTLTGGETLNGIEIISEGSKTGTGAYQWEEANKIDSIIFLLQRHFLKFAESGSKDAKFIIKILIS